MTIENNIKLENITIYKYDEEYYKGLCKYKEKTFQARIKTKYISNESINELLNELNKLINIYFEIINKDN